MLIFVTFLLLVFASTLIYASMNVMKTTSYLKKVCTSTISGTITKNEIDSNYHDGMNYDIFYPVVKYAVNNNIYEAATHFGTIKQIYKENDTVDVHINPSNPKDFWIKHYLNFNDIWLMLPSAAVAIELAIYCAVLTFIS